MGGLSGFYSHNEAYNKIEARDWVKRRKKRKVYEEEL